MEKWPVYKALTIAGSDSGGGAGIQADLKTFQELEVFGMTAVTAVTSQNTLGVKGVYPVETAGILEQIDAIATDIGVDALKTGMLFSAEIIEAVSERIAHYGWRKLVVDPVMVAKGGTPLLKESAIKVLKEKLIPLALLVTPNLPEAEVLVGKKITTEEEKREAAKEILKMGAGSVVIKGGHEGGEWAIDLFYDGEEFLQLGKPRIPTENTHGTGCTFSAAITAELAKGKGLREAIETGKEFVHQAILHSLKIGGGHGPTNHWAYRRFIIHRT
ncbi:bifunctional hydroxy-methylpyrimidine kinase and hydroxy-phosphomethylpyrimidine kinase [[Clostridium] ultunense Esp]|nr:bifunctional hydroxy-methylpyrimidine kinase and hydroxy-phosphomethylpyrimidine kinase [[Clostridium] ultunense Esp]